MSGAKLRNARSKQALKRRLTSKFFPASRRTIWSMSGAGRRSRPGRKSNPRKLYPIKDEHDDLSRFDPRIAELGYLQRGQRSRNFPGALAQRRLCQLDDSVFFSAPGGDGRLRRDGAHPVILTSPSWRELSGPNRLVV